MFIGKNDEVNAPTDADACYEARASEEEIYLEETEEEVHEVLDSDESSGTQNNTPCATENVNQPLDHAAEELITGDGDDPPLSEETVVDMLRISSLRKSA